MKPIVVGAVSRSFDGTTVREAADYLLEHKLFSTEFCLTHTDAKYWNYNGISDISDLSEERFRGYVQLFRERGIEVASIGVFTNVLCAEDEKWPDVFSYFVRHMQLAADADVPVVATECGFRPDSRGVQTHRYESDFARMVEHMGLLCAEAEKLGVQIALEACVLDVVNSAKRAHDFIAQVGSPAPGVLLDPANLIAASDEEDMFKYLAEHTLYFHGKDRKINDTYGRVVGDGDIDWVKFLRLYHKKCAGVPFILEYVNAKNCPQIAERVRAFDRAARAF